MSDQSKRTAAESNCARVSRRRRVQGEGQGRLQGIDTTTALVANQSSAAGAQGHAEARAAVRSQNTKLKEADTAQANSVKLLMPQIEFGRSKTKRARPRFGPKRGRGQQMETRDETKLHKRLGRKPNASKNLLRGTWADLDQADLRLLLQERIGRPGQYDGNRDVLYLPLAREKCRVSLTYKGARIVAIEPGAAFDSWEWERICAEIEGSILNGPQRVGRDFSFSTFPVNGWWRGTQSGVQIIPAPDSAPRSGGGGYDPFILEFPIQDAGLWPITNQRRIREHRNLTHLLNLLLAGTITFLPSRSRHFWACTKFDTKPEIKWVQECYFADLGQVVINALSTQSGGKLQELEPERYYKDVGNDGRALPIPTDLDDLICRYRGLSPILQAKFDRATYWLSMASRQWDDSMSASYASLVSSAEALMSEGGKHDIYCERCKANRSHDVPGATERFRAFFEKYTQDPGLRERRSKMYALRSKILHGSDLMKLDQDRAFGWDPPWWNEGEMHRELWSLVRIAARNWLIDPPVEH
jgi:hypothetical protein